MQNIPFSDAIGAVSLLAIGLTPLLQLVVSMLSVGISFRLGSFWCVITHHQVQTLVKCNLSNHSPEMKVKLPP